MVPRMCHRVSSSPCITLPRAMLPRSSSCFRALHGATRGGTLRCLRLSFRVVLCVSAQFLVLPRTQWCHARLYNPMSHTCRRAVLRVTAQFHVQPRTHGATRGKRLVVFACVSAQLYVLPRSFVCCRAPHGATRGGTDYRLRVASHSYVLPRSLTCYRAPHGATRARTHRRLRLYFRALIHAAGQFYVWPRTYGARAPMVPAHLWCHARKNPSSSSPVLPHSSLDCYKKAASSTVVVSRSSAVVEVGSRRIAVEYSRPTAVVKKRCSGSYFRPRGVQSFYSSRREELLLL